MLEHGNRSVSALMLAGAAALLYGLGAEIVFRQLSDTLLGTLSISFLFLVPFVIGVLTVALSPVAAKDSWLYAFFAPWAVCLVVGVVVYLLAMELWICVVMGLPLFFVMSSLGGVLATWLHRRKPERSRGRDTTTLGLLLVLPFLVMPLEASLPLPMQERTVQTQVVVQAQPEAVWAGFVAVPEIQPDEGPWAWFRVLGLPDPVEATLSAPRAGAMRQARYSNGLAVVEPVLIWEPYTRYRFTVEPDPASLPSPLWRAVEGRHLDVQTVEYWMEPQPDGSLLLHLDSVYRLATPLNPYAGRWLDFLLQDFQEYILQIVKQRAEVSA